MKIVSSLFAVFLGASTLFGQDSGAVRASDETVRKDTTTAVQPARKTGSAGRTEDAITIRSAGSPKAESGPVKAWTLIVSGGWAMVPLGLLSVITVMLVLVYLFTLRRSSILTANYMNTADVLLKKRDYLGLLAISNRHSEAVARIVQRTLDFATKNPNATYEVIKEIAETEGQSQAASLQHRTVYLADIGMLSPMIGLLGTVFGIIESFGVLGSEQAMQTSRDVLLARGVSTALVATASGLILGIVAMGFYSLFRNRVQSLISDLEIASAHVMGLIALNFNKKREQPSRVPIDEEF